MGELDESTKITVAALRLTPLAPVYEPTGEDGVRDLAVATGFIVRNRGELLVTNRHVLAGRDRVTDQPLDPHGSVPHSLRIRHNRAVPPVDGHLAGWVDRIEPLYDGDGRPLWYEYPDHGRLVDVAVLPLWNLTDVYAARVTIVNAHNAVLNAGSSLSVVGYPEGNVAGGDRAIWTSVGIASDYATDYYQGLPSFLVNGSTRRGQSGSPVFFYCGPNDTWIDDGGNWISNGIPKSELVGVYSGQIDQRSSEIGIVWRAQVIRDIIQRGVRPAHNLVS